MLYVSAAALTLLACAVNFVHIGTRSLAFDEATSLEYARLSLRGLVPILTHGDPNMSAYYVLLHWWVRIFGDSEAAARSLSAVFASLTVPVVHRLGVRLFGPIAGFVAALLLALDAFVVQFAQTARTYGMLLFLATLSSYWFVRELQRPSRAGRIAYVLTSALAVYAHYFAGYVLVVHALTLLAIRRRGALSRESITVAVAIGLLTVPAVVFASRAGAHKIIGWIAPPSVSAIGWTLVQFAGGSRVLLVALLAGGAWALVSTRREPEWWSHGFVAAWLVLPVALAFVVSLVQPMFVPYYLIICVPALMLFGAAALKAWPPVLTAAVVAPLIWLAAIQLVAFNPLGSAENWRDSTRYILAATEPEDAIVFFPDGARKPFEYYERRQATDRPWRPARPPRAESRRVWLLVRESDVPILPAEVARIRAALTAGYRLADRRQFRRIGIELYTR